MGRRSKSQKILDESQKQIIEQLLPKAIATVNAAFDGKPCLESKMRAAMQIIQLWKQSIISQPEKTDNILKVSFADDDSDRRNPSNEGDNPKPPTEENNHSG